MRLKPGSAPWGGLLRREHLGEGDSAESMAGALQEQPS
jgi:hypothetical protein